MTKVLVVDDQADVRLIARLSLQAAGHDVLEAETGEEALEVLEDDPTPDAILLDIRMPGIDGWEVLRRLRRNPRLSKLPVVVFTAHVTIRNAPEYSEIGRPFVLTKPFTRQELVDTIDEAMQSDPLPEGPLV